MDGTSEAVRRTESSRGRPVSVVCLKNQFPDCPVNTVARLQDSLATLGFQFVVVIQTFKDRWTLITRPDLTVDVAHQVRWILVTFSMSLVRKSVS